MPRSSGSGSGGGGGGGGISGRAWQVESPTTSRWVLLRPDRRRPIYVHTYRQTGSWVCPPVPVLPLPPGSPNVSPLHRRLTVEESNQV